MIYLIWLLQLPFELILTVLTYPLAPILPLFATNQQGFINNGSATGMGKRLPIWLGWWQTWDNPLEGDQTFQSLHPPCYWSEVLWLIRNPLPCFALRILTNPSFTIKGNNKVTDGAQGVAGWVFMKASGLFQFVWIWQIPGTARCIYVNLGYNIRAITMGAPFPYYATYSFSPRISSFGG
jgi:hypothetical protein